MDSAQYAMVRIFIIFIPVTVLALPVREWVLSEDRDPGIVGSDFPDSVGEDDFVFGLSHMAIALLPYDGRGSANGRTLVLFLALSSKCRDVCTTSGEGRLGRHKTSPHSTEQTWEGFIGGIASSHV